MLSIDPNAFCGSNIDELIALGNYVARAANRRGDWQNIEPNHFTAAENVAGRRITLYQIWGASRPNVYSLRSADWRLTLQIHSIFGTFLHERPCEKINLVYPANLRGRLGYSLSPDSRDYIAHSPDIENPDNFQHEMTILRLFESEWKQRN